MIVKLTPGEMFIATTVGSGRQWQSSYKTEHTKDWTGDLWATNIEAARAEMAVAKGLNRYWSGALRDFRLTDGAVADVGEFEVRTHVADLQDANYCNRLHLIIRPRDNNDAKFILVLGRRGDYVLKGWMGGKDAKVSKYLRNPDGRGDAWFVPIDQLKSMDLIAETT